MARIYRKYERGAATNYVTRKAALKKLQLSLKDFRRLCILKGIHPHEPKHKKKVNKGSTDIKTWYYAKDIAFLQHEPIIQKFRDYKVFLRRLKKAKCKREGASAQRLQDNKPIYKLDHVVKERYPTFIDSIRDLDDGLCLLFLFARLPRSLKVPCETVKLCRRLTVEFMHYVIEAKALRKAFVSIKGIYYQAEIMGQTVNWIVAHERAMPSVSEVDFQVMATFVEFYSTAVKFINYRLFRELGLHYPPQIGQSQVDDFELYVGDMEAMQERLYSLSEQLKKDATTSSQPNDEIIEPSIDHFPDNPDVDVIEDESTRKNKEREKLKKLFVKCKFFLSRETPRESLTFVIRCCGGSVSWYNTVAYGSTYQESDESITHHIIDRPAVADKQYLSRRYLQPQWVYDCLNAVTLLPVDNYVPGAVLPPHLSPFVQESVSDYVPPEKIALLEQQGHDVSGMITADQPSAYPVTSDQEDQPENKSAVETDQEKKEIDVSQDAKMNVSAGKVRKVNAKHARTTEKTENRKMREMMIPKKQRRVYQKIVEKTKHVNKEALRLKEKRERIEKESRKKK